MLRLAFGRLRRQSEGLLRSAARPITLEIGIPDRIPLSRRTGRTSSTSCLASYEV